MKCFDETFSGNTLVLGDDFEQCLRFRMHFKYAPIDLKSYVKGDFLPLV